MQKELCFQHFLLHTSPLSGNSCLVGFMIALFPGSPALTRIFFFSLTRSSFLICHQQAFNQVSSTVTFLQHIHHFFISPHRSLLNVIYLEPYVDILYCFLQTTLKSLSLAFASIPNFRHVHWMFLHGRPRNFSNVTYLKPKLSSFTLLSNSLLGNR